MIKLHKRPIPPVLKQNTDAWTQALSDRAAANETPTRAELTRYGHPQIKNTLLEETNSKCAYCESKFRHVEPGDVEHIVPKRKSVDLYFRWTNLTIACSVCNTNKGTQEFLIDPYEDDPENSFLFLGPMILPEHDDQKAIATETVLKLNRIPLLERRTERLRGLHRLFVLASQLSAPAKEIILNELTQHETRDDAEFAAMARSYVRSLRSSGQLAN